MSARSTPRPFLRHGKRKNAVARVWVKAGSGKIVVNGKDITAYFARPVLQMILRQPLVAANRDGQFDIIATVVAAVCPVRPVRSVTACPRRSHTSNPACARS